MSRFGINGLLLLVWGWLLAGCGTSSPGPAPVSDGAREFTVARYNDAGIRDGGLRSTLDITVEETGSLTVVNISVADDGPMWGAAVDLEYDQELYTPVDVEFLGLVENQLDFSCLEVPGLAGIGQVATDGAERRSGKFARVTFQRQSLKSASVAGSVWTDPVDTVYEPEVASDLTSGMAGWTVTSRPLEWDIYSVFAAADGNSDGHTTIGDLTAIGRYWGRGMVSDEDYSVAIADYDRNGILTVADLAPLGQHFEESVTGFEIWASASVESFYSGYATKIDEISWESGVKADVPAGDEAITDWEQVFRHWHGELDKAVLEEIDSNDWDYDGTVLVMVRAVNADCTGEFSDPVYINYIYDDSDSVWITDFAITVSDASCGSGETSAEFWNGDVIEAVANETAVLEVTSVSGTFNGEQFTGYNFPGEVDYYEQILVAFNESIICESSDLGADGMMLTQPVVTLEQGEGQWLVVFGPDDDLEPEPEGLLTVTFPWETYYQYWRKRTQAVPPHLFWVEYEDIVCSLQVDLQADLRAVEVTAIETSAGILDDSHLISAVDDTTVTGVFRWGTQQPAGDSEIGVSLFDLTDGTAVLNLTHTTADPPGVGEFTLRTDPEQEEGTEILVALISPGSVTAGHLYTLRIEVDGVCNSVNRPGEFLLADGGS